MRTRFVAMVVLGLALAGCGGSVSSASPAASAKPLSLGKVRFAIPVTSGLQVLPQIALDSGYFADEGLDVSIIQVSNSQDVIAALNRGDLDMSNTDSPSTLQAHLSGIAKIAPRQLKIERRHRQLDLICAQDLPHLPQHLLDAHVRTGIARAVVSGE